MNGRRRMLAMCLAGLAMLAASGCSSMPKLSWPWGKPPPAAAQPVDELTIVAEGGATIAQYWEGNTLVLDMTGVASTGKASATPAYERGWPMRIAVRTLPGRFGTLDVKGAQRVVLPLSTEGATTVELRVPQGVYPKGTKQLDFAWGPSITPPVQPSSTS